MKIFVKTLKGDRFEIQVEPEDSVADVKKKIETTLGVTAAEQMLIHKGKVLKDETTVEANNVSEKSIIGVMKKRKPASTGTSSTSSATETPRLSTELDLNYESISESNIQQILRVARAGAFSREAIFNAFCSPYNDIEEPDSPPSVADLERSLDFSRYNEEYEYLREMAQSDPSIGKDYVEMLEEYRPLSFQFIRDNKPDFLRFLLERGTDGNQVGEPEETKVEQPPQELQVDQTNKPNKGGGDGYKIYHAKPTEPAWDAAASNVNYENISESNIQWIIEMSGEEHWERDLVVDALRFANNDIDKAVEYIYFGVSVQSEDPYITEGTSDQTQEPEDAAQEWPLDILRHTPEDLREERNPPPMFQLIQDNKADFLPLVLEKPQEQPQDDDVLHFQSNEPNNKGGDSGNQVGESEEAKVEQRQADQTHKPTNNGGDGGNKVGESKETEVEVATPEDHELIERLEALGFERGDAAVAYFACNRNVQVAANHLLGYKHESRRE